MFFAELLSAQNILISCEMKISLLQTQTQYKLAALLPEKRQVLQLAKFFGGKSNCNRVCDLCCHLQANCKSAKHVWIAWYQTQLWIFAQWIRSPLTLLKPSVRPLVFRSELLLCQSDNYSDRPVTCICSQCVVQFEKKNYLIYLISHYPLLNLIVPFYISKFCILVVFTNKILIV